MRKIFVTMLLAGVLLTGCAQNNESAAESQNTENASDAMLETEVATTEDTAAEQETETEQEPYILSFEAPTIEGGNLTSDCFADSKLTMLNVWATYCSPCLNEMPDLGEIANAYDKSEFQMIGIISDVYADADADTIQTAKDLIIETKADYPHVLLSDSLYSNLLSGVTSVPTTFFVNQKGEVLGYAVGAQSKESWEEIINELLAKEK